MEQEQPRYRRSSIVNKSMVRSMRKGTLTVPKTDLDKIIETNYGNSRLYREHPINSQSRKSSFLTHVKRRSLIGGRKCKFLQEVRFPQEYRGLYNIKFAPDSERFITSYGGGCVQMWNLNSEEECVDIIPAQQHGFPIMSLQFIPNSPELLFFAAGACGSIFLCGMKEGQHFEFVKEEGNEVNAVDVNISGATLVSGGKDAALRIYDVNSGKMKHKLERGKDGRGKDFHKMRIFAIRFCKDDNNVFLSGGWDDCVKVWDLRVKRFYVRQIKGPHICGEAVDTKDNKVVTGSWISQRSLQIWDLMSGKLISPIIPVNRPTSVDGEFLYCAHFFKGDPTGCSVVTGGSGLGAVEVIDIEEKRVMSSFTVYKSVQAMDSTMNYLIFGGMASTFNIIGIKDV